MALLLRAYFIFSCLHRLTETNSVHLPRMLFTDKETAVKRLPLIGHHEPVRILPERRPDAVTTAGQTHLHFYDFQNPKKTAVERKMPWQECINNDCNYNITLVHPRGDGDQVFVCGTNGRETVCCDTNFSEQSPMRIPTEKMQNIRDSIREFIIKKDEQSVLDESKEISDLYTTYSGSGEYVGIHKFGRERVMPVNPDTEQHYVGLVLSRREDDHSQDRVYAFYKQKNRDTGVYSDMWLPFVTQVCMADVGGPKNHLQFRWTSQMNARLLCRDPNSRQYFSELVDMATVHADQWQDTKVYALFRNGWGMSAVCVYTIRDIDHIFSHSPFKGSTSDNQINRPRTCVRDSTKIPSDILRTIEKASEMELWVRPVNNSGPLLLNSHNYTHIYVDSLDRNSHDGVIFLSLNNGGIHKVMQNKSHSFFIAEYRPFSHRAHILGIIVHPSSRKLYVTSRSELVQLDVTNCANYGNTCEDCILSRDPYCDWNGRQCIPVPQNTLPDVARWMRPERTCLLLSKLHSGKEFKYSTSDLPTDENGISVRLPPQSKYYLLCPVSSRHAQYTWHKPENTTSCSLREEQCLILIDSMGPEHVGTYTCVSEEMGYSKVLARYHLQLESRAVGQLSSPVVWVCLMVALVMSLSY